MVVWQRATSRRTPELYVEMVKSSVRLVNIQTVQFPAGKRIVLNLKLGSCLCFNDILCAFASVVYFSIDFAPRQLKFRIRSLEVQGLGQDLDLLPENFLH
jgi:hypothetical protein